MGLEPTKTTQVIVLGGRSCVPEGGGLVREHASDSFACPPFRRFATPPSTTPLLWLAGVFPGGSFSSPPPPDYSDDARRITRPRRLGAASARVGGKPPFPHSAAPGDRAPTWSAHELLQFGPNQAGRGRRTARLPPIIWVELDRPQGSGFHRRSYARGRALENVGGALPCLGFPLSGGDGPTLVGGRPPPPSLLSPPPPSRLLGGGGHAAEGRLADDCPSALLPVPRPTIRGTRGGAA